MRTSRQEWLGPRKDGDLLVRKVPFQVWSMTNWKLFSELALMCLATLFALLYFLPRLISRERFSLFKMYLFLIKGNCFTVFSIIWLSHRFTCPIPWTSLPPPLPPYSTPQVVTQPQFELPESYSKFPLAIYLRICNVYFLVGEILDRHLTMNVCIHLLLLFSRGKISIYIPLMKSWVN